MDKFTISRAERDKMHITGINEVAVRFLESKGYKHGDIPEASKVALKLANELQDLLYDGKSSFLDITQLECRDAISHAMSTITGTEVNYLLNEQHPANLDNPEMVNNARAIAMEKQQNKKVDEDDTDLEV